MPVSPEQLLTAAEALLERGSEEVDWRNAASRAYYASYHRCSVIAKSSTSFQWSLRAACTSPYAKL